MSRWHIGGCAIRDSGQQQVDGLRAPHLAPVNAPVDELIDPPGRGWVPYVASAYGGVDARALCIQRDPATPAGLDWDPVTTEVYAAAGISPNVLATSERYACPSPQSGALSQKAGSLVTSVGAPPVAGMMNTSAFCSSPPTTWPSAETTHLPLGENAHDAHLPVPGGVCVSWCRPEPSGCTSQMLPLVSQPSQERNAIHRPLGEYCGWEASSFQGVIRRTPPPSGRTVKIACRLSEILPRSNASCRPLGDHPGAASKKRLLALAGFSDLSVSWRTPVPSGVMTKIALNPTPSGLLGSADRPRWKAISPVCDQSGNPSPWHTPVQLFERLVRSDPSGRILNSLPLSRSPCRITM
jgi:hypothetical protein